MHYNNDIETVSLATVTVAISKLCTAVTAVSAAEQWLRKRRFTQFLLIF